MKGLADELRDGPYVVIDGIDGRAHYMALPPSLDLSLFPVGAIGRGEQQSRSQLYRSTHRFYGRGWYLSHRAALAQLRGGGIDEPERIVGAHVRRLEALRRVPASLSASRMECGGSRPTLCRARSSTIDADSGVSNFDSIAICRLKSKRTPWAPHGSAANWSMGQLNRHRMASALQYDVLRLSANCFS